MSPRYTGTRDSRRQLAFEFPLIVSEDMQLVGIDSGHGFAFKPLFASWGY